MNLSLHQEQCEACRSDAICLTVTEAQSYLQTLNGWSLQTADSVMQLHKTFSTKSFAESMAFAQLIGELAESQNHHPSITVQWGKVSVVWWTHKIGGLHRNDVIMAAKTDELWQAENWLAGLH